MTEFTPPLSGGRTGRTSHPSDADANQTRAYTLPDHVKERLQKQYGPPRPRRDLGHRSNILGRLWAKWRKSLDNRSEKS